MTTSIRLGLAAALAVLPATPAAALFNSTSVSGISTDPYFNSNSFSKSAPTYSVGQQQASGPGWSTSGTGFAELGKLRVASSVAFQNFDASGGANSLFSLATASFTDQLFLPPPPFNSPPKIFATVKFKLTGNLDVTYGGTGSTGDSRAFISLFTEQIFPAGVTSTAKFDLLTGIGWNSMTEKIDLYTTKTEEYNFLNTDLYGDISTVPSLFGEYEWKFRVGLSGIRTISVTMGCLSYVSDFVAASNNAVSCKLDNSFEWLGMTFTDENGDPIAADPITSASGQNYNVPFSPMPAVPEPASWAMLIAGFGQVGAAARRRRRTRAA